MARKNVVQSLTGAFMAVAITNATADIYNPTIGVIKPDLPPEIVSTNLQHKNLQHPAIQDYLSANNVSVVITDDALDDVKDQMNRENPFDDPDSSNRSRLDYSTEFFNILLDKNPETKQMVEGMMEQQAEFLKHNNFVSSDGISVADQATIDTARYLAGLDTPYSAISIETQIPQWASADLVAENHQSSGLILPGSDSQAAMDMFADHLELLDFEANRLPGQAKHYGAFVTAHEMEHISGNDQQETGRAYYEVLENFDQSGIDYDLSYAGMFYSQIHEIDADIGAFNALDGQVPEEVLEHIAASRIAVQDETRILDFINQAGYERNSGYDPSEASTDNPLYISGEYDIGFHVMEFLQTGQVPDYAEMQSNVNGFYRKTADYYLDKMEAQFDTPEEKQQFRDNNDLIGVPTSEEFLGLVNEAQTEGVYSPAESQIAQTYTHSMSDILGAKIKPSEQTIEKSLERYNKGLRNMHTNEAVQENTFAEQPVTNGFRP